MRFVTIFYVLGAMAHKTARQKFLMELLIKDGQAGINFLVEKLQVSVDTVRRDLVELEKRLAQKNHGGAVVLNLSAMSRTERSTLIPEIKYWAISG